MENEMIYDDDAMKNTHLLLVTANNEVRRARESYNSSKLAGDSLVTEAEDFMSDIRPYLENYNHATEKIYVGEASTKSLSFQQPTSNQTVVNTQEPWENLPSVNDEPLVPNNDKETADEIDLSNYSDDSFRLQKMLCDMGYNIGEIDGVIGENTLKALSSFLLEQEIDLVNTLQKSIEITLDYFNCLSQEYGLFFETLESKIIAETATDEEKVKYAQFILQKLGYYPASEGINGARTDTTKFAIQIYCEANDIKLDVINDMSFEFWENFWENFWKKNVEEDQKTYAEFKLEKYSTILSGKSNLDMNDDEQCKDIQRMLKASGYYLGSIDGNLGEEIIIAVKHLCEDKGLGSIRITNWCDINTDMLEKIVTTDKKGLEGFKLSENWTPEEGFIGVAKEKKMYTATHGYGYCTTGVRYIDTTSIIVPRSGISEDFLPEEKKEQLYIVDCSAGVESCVYEYLKACGFEALAEKFTGNMNVWSFHGIYENGGKVDGVQIFDIVSSEDLQAGEDLQPGDIIMDYNAPDSKDNHMEIYCEIDEDGKLLVYNWGTSEYIREPGITVDDSRSIDEYNKVLRIKTPEELEATVGK